MKNKLLIVQVAALGPQQAPPGFRRTKSIFPAVTCTVQASFRTALLPSEHGMVGNGLFFPELRKVLFWEQASALVEGERIWERFRARGKRVGMLFWQQSLGEEVDIILSPAPIHKHSGGMIQDCYSQPRELQARIVERIGRPFNLMHYWGPLASNRSTEWIVEATAAVMELESPDLLFTYLPHLDYDLQRFGPGSDAAERARMELHGQIRKLHEAAETRGYEILVFGDYAIEPVTDGAVFPNRVLREAGLFATREIRGMLYPDFFSAKAFAVVDHAVAHVYTNETKAARAALERLPGVDRVLDRTQQQELGIAHPRSGDLVLMAAAGVWFAYPWWEGKGHAPDFATHVDIHNKPGYDPCELFFGWPPPSVSMNTKKIRGTHGRVSDVAWESTLNLGEPATQVDLAAAVKAWLENVP